MFAVSGAAPIPWWFAGSTDDEHRDFSHHHRAQHSVPAGVDCFPVELASESESGIFVFVSDYRGLVGLPLFRLRHTRYAARRNLDPPSFRVWRADPACSKFSARCSYRTSSVMGRYYLEIGRTAWRGR